jgi:UrcA family protein
MSQFTNRLNGTRFFGVTLATLAASVLLGTATAAPAVDAPSVKVTYSDLNLASEAGTQVLYSRIVSAARSVCFADDVDSRDLGAVASERQCEQLAIANAVSAVHNQRLAALFTAHTARG